MATPYGFDLAGSIGAGQQLGAQQTAIRQRNALADLYRTQGAGIASGDPAAMNALAQIDPMAAFDMQRQRAGDARADAQLQMERDRLGMARERQGLEMQYTTQQLDNARQQGRINMETHAAKMDALQAAKIAEGLTLGLQGAAMAYRQGPEAYAQYVQSNAQDLQALGLTPEQLSYENFLPTAATVKGGIEALSNAASAVDAMNPQYKPQSGAGKFYADQAAGAIPPGEQYKGTGPNITVNTGPNEGEFAKETGKLMAKEAGDIVTQGAQAQRAMGSVEQLGQALQNAPQGAQGALTSMASSLGLKMEGASDVELADAIINQLVPQQRPPGSGTMSDADLALFKRSLPRIINSPDGNRKIIGYLRAIAEYDMQRGNIARQWQLGSIDAAEADRQFGALGNPLGSLRADLEAVPQGGSVQMDIGGSTYTIQRLD